MPRHSLGAQMTTRLPRRRDAATKALALVGSGATHAPAAEPAAVNAHVGRKPAKPGGRSWQGGEPVTGPPIEATTARRSMAKLTARRTRTSSNGGAWTFIHA